MAIATIPGFDTEGAHVDQLPHPDTPYIVAGYVTGKADVPWSPAAWAQYPAAVRIAQSPDLAADEAAHADVLDYENGAATLADLGPWAKNARAAYSAGTRPGQRTPVIYASASNLTPVCNALVAAGVSAGVGLWVAHWGLAEATAQGMVANASGPFPVVAVQFDHGAGYDSDVFSVPWLQNVSRAPVNRTAVGLVVQFADGTSERFTI